MKLRLNPVTELIVGGLLASTALGVRAQAAPESSGTQIERITITAEKRTTVLDTTPASITALNGSKLAEQGATNFADMLALSPNTSFTTGQGASQIFVRGIGNVFILAGGDPGVALYADGSYVSDQTSSNVSLFDTQRVEILRGPQGALYGRNATGGAMNLIAARPTANFQAKGGVLFGEYGRREVEGFVSGPLFGGSGGGTLGRLSFQAKQLDGYTSNPLAGQSFGPVLPGGRSTVGPDKLDDHDSRAIRLQTATDFSSGTNLRLIAGHYRQKDAGPSMPLLADPVMIPQLLFGAVPSTDPRIVESQGASNQIDVSSVQAILEQPVGAHTLRATLSWRKSEADRFWDSDTTEALVATSSFSTASTDKSIDVHIASEEGGALQWLVGATHLRFDQRQDIDIQTQIPLGFLAPGAPFTVPMPGGVAFVLGGKVFTRSSAVYGDFRYALTPKFSLLGGLRYNRDSKRAEEYQQIAAFGLNARGTPSDSWTSTPASLGAEYKLSADALAYGRVASGFKSGAVNLGSVQGNLVRPEKSLGVELGFKTSFWQRRGAFSAAVFSTDYKDMQVSQVGTATVILANAAKSRINGVEVEIGVKPAAELTLGLGLGLMDPKYKDFVNADLRNMTPPVNVKGNQLAFASKSQAALSAEYTPTIAGMRASMRADVVWRSKVFFTEFNTADAVQDSYGMLNLSASIRPANGKWKVYGWVRNATDKTAITSMSIASPLLGAARQVTYTPPRQFGIGASLEF
ncbi:TonB-dependent receptor [Aquincola sp. S2]|uniref:TonB-dependent receptor n=1 Tax=Pseudaquabacterium terrae TaxID=2732868 RepID=A0ABX2EJW2_9BURK|nr:TonB-dependent receptor [Aquabacterium terrae]NRF68931.1 TonB-dependent receptor [Aquabacterium terrae]